MVTEIRITGDFDDAAAARVIDQIARVKGATVRVDLREARELHDTAVAIFARALDARVFVIGLSRHHEQLLRYLGAARPQETTTSDAIVTRTRGE